MAANGENSTPVLIVGGSLVGLSAAVFLAWRGVPVVVVEKHTASSTHPRAIGFTTRTAELFRAVGIALPDTTQGHGPPRRTKAESLSGRWYDEYPWTTRSEEPSLEYSPELSTAVTQDRLEPILRERAIELGADLRLGTELVCFTQDGAGVTATLRPRGGAEYELNAQYLIAADGANSPVRQALTIGRSGQGLLSVQRSILFRAPIDHYLERGVVQFEIEQPTLTAFLTTYTDGRWLLMLGDDVERDDDQKRAVVRQALGLPDAPIELIASGRWEIAALIADRFAADRVFLAGDAAHQLPPNRGGYGANTGIDDVHNLAWKLASVLSGASATRLLDTYNAERRPIAWLRHEQIFARADYKAHLDAPKSDVVVIDDIAMELGQLYRSAAIGAARELPAARRPDQWAGQPGTRAPHLRLRNSGGELISTLDTFQRGWVVLSESDRWADAVAGAAAALELAVSFIRIDPAKVEGPQPFRDAFGITAAGATLVRPDGYIATRWATTPDDPTHELTQTLSHVAASPRSTDALGNR